MGSKEQIEIKGARVNNLKNIDIAIPSGKLVVITGLSGSGKSSLAFDTLYAEGQRRYVESLSSYARQFMGRMATPEVDYIHGISPAVAIEQRVNSSNPRSTVGTTTEIYEYLKLMFARIGKTYSPVSGVEVKRHSVSDVVDHIASLPDGSKVYIFAPLEDLEERPLGEQLKILLQEGFVRVAIAGTIVRIEDYLTTSGKEKCQDAKLLVDRMEFHAEEEGMMARIGESVQTAFFEGRGECEVQWENGQDNGRAHFSNRFEADGITFEKPNANFFSFNNPYGACPTCGGYGSIIGIDERLVVPNPLLSIYEGAVVCWKGEKMQEWKDYLIKQASKIGVPIHTPYRDLTEEQKGILWHGKDKWEGIDGFFKWVESQSYKIQYRVMLSRYRGKTVCPTCHGTRLRPDADYVKIGGKSISELAAMQVSDLNRWIEELQLTSHEQEITARIMVELRSRVGYLMEVGLGYLTLSRHSNTLSGGESQRINLATSLGSSLVGSMYILDEPSIGLHPRDTEQLIDVLKKLRDLGNTVIVVEHDEDIIRSADYIIDIGPGAGRLGGEVVFAGHYDKGWHVGLSAKKPTAEMQKRSYTLQYLDGKLSIDVPTKRRRSRDKIVVHKAYCNNLKQVDVAFPLNMLTVVTGVSGSGKTSLVKQVLYDVLQHRFGGNPEYVGQCEEIDGDVAMIKGVELVDQNPIGRSTRSNPATYMKAYDEIRQLYASLPLAKSRGYKASYFSFNTEGGRCETCQGEGYVTIGMQFMSDLHLVCEDCHGTRFRDETLEVTYHGKNVSEVLDMTIDQAIEFFGESEEIPEEESAAAKSARLSRQVTLKAILNRLKPLQDVGLGYLKMGQSSSSLSGGEAQRVKLASYLIKGGSEQPRLFIFDEPSTGLHFHHIQKLIQSFNTLIANGHSVVVIEHHPDIIKVADWVVDMGPEGGDQGGNVVFAGTPEDLVKCKQSHTAKFIKDKLK